MHTTLAKERVITHVGYPLAKMSYQSYEPREYLQTMTKAAENILRHPQSTPRIQLRKRATQTVIQKHILLYSNQLTTSYLNFSVHGPDVNEHPAFDCHRQECHLQQ